MVYQRTRKFGGEIRKFRVFELLRKNNLKNNRNSGGKKIDWSIKTYARKLSMG